MNIYSLIFELNFIILKKIILLLTIIIIFLIEFQTICFARDNNKVEKPEQFSQIYKARRNQLISSLSPNKLILVYNLDKITDNLKLYYGNPKNINMLYLIGKDIENSILLLSPKGIMINTRNYNEILFKYEQSNFEKIWDGPSATLYEIENNLGVEKALNLSYLDYYLDTILADIDTLYLLPSNIVPDNSIEGNFLNSKDYKSCLYQIYFPKLSKYIEKYHLTVLTELDILNKMREVKDSLEIYYIQKAVDITTEGHLEAMRRIEAGMTEYQLQSIIEGTFLYNGASGTAYQSIVTSGKNAHILHRRLNLDTLHSGDLVIIDCGAEYNGYCADITRTIPVNGKFSEEQKIIYNIVLEAIDSALSVCKVGKLYMLPHQKAVNVIKKRLKEIGIIKNESEFANYFNHGTSHYIGLEVHDVGTYGTFKSGNIITIEPGIYIPEGSPCDSKWWRICVRVEEDVLITNAQPIVLSSKLPRSITEIEKIMNRKE